MRYWLAFFVSAVFFLAPLALCAQELFPLTEPASNMATDALGLRLSSNFFPDSNRLKTQVSPEIMYGINAKLMVHASAYFSDYYSSDFKQQGASAYLKYRFLSRDDDHSHFRMAAFGRGSVNTNRNASPDINIEGIQAGWAAGIIATQLLHRLALSVTLAGEKPVKPGGDFYPEHSYVYSLSAGYLLFPKNYSSYRQLNLNLYTELLGRTNSASAERNFVPGSALDIAPCIQLIFQSRTRIDLSYRTSLYNDIHPPHHHFIIKIEHNLFNAFRNHKKETK